MDADAKKMWAAMSSVVWSAVLTIMKFVVGIMTGSLGILSEALHSALDLLAALGSLFAVRIAALPADAEHPYGHGKVENLMALVETLLLLATAGWVVAEAAERLMSDDAAVLHVETSVWAFGVVIVSLLVDVNRAAMLHRVAKETKSAALEADAAHFSSDIWSSAAVLLGLIGAACVGFAEQGSLLYEILLRMDVLASLGVVLIILHICWTLGKKAINNLMDISSPEAVQELRSLLAERMPVYPVTRLRVREVGLKLYVEADIAVPKEMHVDTAHEIATAIEDIISQAHPGAETIVHMHPTELQEDTPELRIRRIALAHRLGIHGLTFLPSSEGLVIFADIELPPGATLSGWDIAVRAFRKDVQLQLHAERVVVHLEPDIRPLPEFPAEVPADWSRQIHQAMLRIGAPLPTSVHLYCQGAQRLCVVTVPEDKSLNIRDSHTYISAINSRLRQALPADVARIVVSYE